MSNYQRIEIVHSRRLIGSPDWSGLGIIFDARSGDFWIVSSETKNALLNDGSGTVQLSDKDVIENLIAHGIIRASHTS